MAVTIRELAAACGLSVSTVSKALNDYKDVSGETRAMVRETAERLGYRPSAIARGLKMGRTQNLGVLYQDDSHSGFTHNYFAPILEAFKREAERRGYDITFITSRTGANKMTYLEHCLYRNVDGVAMINCHFSDPQAQELIAGPLPVVTIDHAFDGRSCVQSQNEEGMTELTRYILSMGHRRIAFVSGEDVAVTRTRRACFVNAMNAAGVGVPEAYMVYSRFHDPSAARAATAKLLALPTPPTCIIMSDDYAALGGMEAIRAAGLRIPEDISVAGFDGVPLLQMCSPKLTTIRQDTETIGLSAARRLVHLIERPQVSRRLVVPVPCQLIEGETVARI